MNGQDVLTLRYLKRTGLGQFDWGATAGSLKYQGAHHCREGTLRGRFPHYRTSNAACRSCWGSVNATSLPRGGLLLSCLPNTVYTQLTGGDGCWETRPWTLPRRPFSALVLNSVAFPTPCVAFLVPSAAFGRNKGFIQHCAQGRREWSRHHGSREVVCYLLRPE